MTAEQTLSQRKRADIMRAAVAEFQTRGFSDVSMERVAAAAEVSKRTLYRHFANKDMLFQACIRGLLAENETAVDLAYAGDEPLRTQLQRIAIAEVEMFSTDRYLRMARIFLAEAFRDLETVRDVLGDLQGVQQVFATWVEQAAADGRLRVGDVAIAVQQFLALLKGPLYWPRVVLCTPRSPADVQAQVIDAAVEMFLSQYAVKD